MDGDSVVPGADLVVDASVVLAIVLEEDRRNEALGILRPVASTGFAVPAHWPLEVGNTLMLVERRGRISRVERDIAIAALEAMAVLIDQDIAGYAWRETLVLGQRHGLTLYDAAYLELALRLGVPLATFDRALARAAVAEGVAVAE